MTLVQIQKGALFPLDSYQGQIHSDMVYAATGQEGKDSCQEGDSGGLLIISGNDFSSDILVGVVSWGYGWLVAYQLILLHILIATHWETAKILLFLNVNERKTKHMKTIKLCL